MLVHTWLLEVEVQVVSAAVIKANNGRRAAILTGNHSRNENMAEIVSSKDEIYGIPIV